MEVTSGCVMMRVKNGVRCVWRVCVMPKEVVTNLRIGEATDTGRMVGRRVM